jgi:hypothetical protein
MPRDDSIRCSPPNHVRGPEDRGAGHLVTLRRSKICDSRMSLAAAACSAGSQRRRRSAEIGSRNRRLLGDENVHSYELCARGGASGPICATRLRTNASAGNRARGSPKCRGGQATSAAPDACHRLPGIDPWLVPHRHRPRAEPRLTHELQIDGLR